MLTLTYILFTLLLQSPTPAPKKVEPDVLAHDKCHYIIQGANLNRLSSLNQQPFCLSWHSFATYAQHLAALRLYRDEVEQTWPPDKPRGIELTRDLAIIDAELKEAK